LVRWKIGNLVVLGTYLAGRLLVACNID